AAGVALARARAFHLAEPLRDTVAYVAQVSEGPWIDEYLDGLAAEPVLRRDSLAYRLGGAGTTRLGGLPLTLGSHLRASSTEPLPQVIARFPHHLQETWEAESVRQLPAIALKKLKRLARRGRRKSAGSRLHV
ncbi:MAG: hypothetical protein QOD43_1831, partial [Gaiellaceae bacterium]|nr:hypothetical protein [Gaiellaceae bacterium]